MTTESRGLGATGKRVCAIRGDGSGTVFGSGYMANLGLLTALLKKDDLVFSDALNHASLIDGMRPSDARKIIYSHLDLKTLKAELQKYAHERARKLIVHESVFGMEGDIARLRRS